MANRIELTTEWINQKVREGRIFGIVWKELGLVPEQISMREDGKTFDITISCLPYAGDKDEPTKLMSAKEASTKLRTAIESAVDANSASTGYKLGTFAVKPLHIHHPVLTQ